MRLLLCVGALAIVGAAAAAAPSKAGDLRGDFCQGDEGCRWDDPCKPTRCVGAPGAAPSVTCKHAAPAPGSCRCVEQMCTLRPSDAATATSAETCKRDEECAIDVGGGTCHVGGETLIGPIFREGPVCTCDKPSGRCQLEWAGPVACKSWRDCSWVTRPRLRPVPASRVKRPVPRPVRACKDGEVDSICTPEGTCKIVGWGC